MKQPRNELAMALRSCRSAIVAIAFASGLVNILYLTGALYMMEVYDRVLASRSIPTLVGLTVLAFSLYAFQGVLDMLRSRVLVRVGRSLGDRLGARVYQTIGFLARSARTAGDGLQPMRDIDQVRGFLSSAGPLALLDLPWLPFYIGICFLLHVWIGVTALVGGILLVVLTLLTDRFTRDLAKAATTLASRRNAIAEASRRNAEVLHAMGMEQRFGGVWSEVNAKYLDSQQRVSDVTGGLGAISKVLRLALQSAVLGVGAYLVIQQQSTGGIIIAGSILAARALAPVDLAIANWRNFVAFRQSWRRLKELLAIVPPDEEQMALPTPETTFAVENVTVVPPSDKRAVVQDATFRLEKGQGLGIIGPSAAGKSCLARALVGVWPAARGKIRLDGAALDQWTAASLGRHIGYLPQDVELLSGTVSQNIARFDPKPDPGAVIAAAKAASVHDLILHLPQGYETDIGESGTTLSAGQRQRLALARALYGDPFLVVLDEPNSNLDSDGEEALSQAILGIRKRGGIAIVIAHRPSALSSVDLVMLMVQGKVQMFGPKDEVLGKLRRPLPAPAAPLRVVSDPGGVS